MTEVLDGQVSTLCGLSWFEGLDVYCNFLLAVFYPWRFRDPMESHYSSLCFGKSAMTECCGCTVGNGRLDYELSSIS